MAVIDVPIDVNCRERLDRLAAREMPAIDRNPFGLFVETVGDHHVLLVTGAQFAEVLPRNLILNHSVMGEKCQRIFT